MATWKLAFNASELEIGKARALDLGDGLRVAVCRTTDGIYAIEDVCSHDGGALDQGQLLGDKIECPRHGAMFDVKTGKALSLPAVKDIRSFGTKIENGEIYIAV